METYDKHNESLVRNHGVFLCSFFNHEFEHVHRRELKGKELHPHTQLKFPQRIAKSLAKNSKEPNWHERKQRAKEHYKHGHGHGHYRKESLFLVRTRILNSKERIRNSGIKI